MANLWHNNKLVKKSYKKWQGSEKKKKELHLYLVLSIKHFIGFSICHTPHQSLQTWLEVDRWLNFCCNPLLLTWSMKKKKFPLATRANRQIYRHLRKTFPISWRRKKKLADNTFFTSAAQWKSSGSNIS